MWLARVGRPHGGQMTATHSKPSKGSRNKYAFELEQQIFQLRRVLPVGMSFSYDFGLIPSTAADDCDPVDVLVLMDDFSLRSLLRATLCDVHGIPPI
jgi:inorganic pyrophosphatase